MRPITVPAVLAVAVAVAAMGTVMASTAEDDLAVVKRAVRQDAAPGPRADVDKDALRWFKVRITEKGSKKARVSVNLPIALVRALGDDFPIDIGRHAGRDGWRMGRSEKVLRLGEVLATLEAGQALVEIDDDDATVRVWVE